MEELLSLEIEDKDKFIRLCAQVIRMHEEAYKHVKAGNTAAAIMYFDRASSGPFARLMGMAPEAVKGFIDASVKDQLVPGDELRSGPGK